MFPTSIMSHVLNSVSLFNKRKESSIPSLIPDVAAFEKRLAGLPVVKTQPAKLY
jgi:hypothetical protein